MAVYVYGVLANRPPILQITTSLITGTTEDTLTFSGAMTRLVVKNTGTAALTFSVNGAASLTDSVEAGATLDDSFLEFNSLVLSGTTGSSYTVMVG
ncbi:MAG: hypothetical protein H6Q73_1814 [Firmicutes bacterium]|nr:hypothetical protein [Bacillota bacterium]